MEGQPLWLPSFGQAQGQPVQLPSPREIPMTRLLQPIGFNLALQQSAFLRPLLMSAAPIVSK